MNTVILAASNGLYGPVTDPFASLPYHIEYMLGKKVSTLVGGGQLSGIEIGLTINTVGFVLTAIFVGWLCYVLAKRMTLVPTSRGANAFEFLIEFVRNNIANAIHHDRRKYEPFLLTTFFFILISNFIGLIPNAKFATGTIGGTFALAMAVFFYFHYAGVKAKGGWGYTKGIVPHGVPGWLAPAIWLIEVISMFLRPVSLALRLWANMYAGHIMLGIFALLTGLFAQATIDGNGPFIAAAPGWMLLLFVIYVIEILICVIAAYVFTLLTAVYIEGAVADH